MWKLESHETFFKLRGITWKLTALLGLWDCGNNDSSQSRGWVEPGRLNFLAFSALIEQLVQRKTLFIIFFGLQFLRNILLEIEVRNGKPLVPIHYEQCRTLDPKCLSKCPS